MTVRFKLVTNVNERKIFKNNLTKINKHRYARVIFFVNNKAE